MKRYQPPGATPRVMEHDVQGWGKLPEPHPVGKPLKPKPREPAFARRFQECRECRVRLPALDGLCGPFYCETCGEDVELLRKLLSRNNPDHVAARCGREPEAASIKHEYSAIGRFTSMVYADLDRFCERNARYRFDLPSGWLLKRNGRLVRLKRGCDPVRCRRRRKKRRLRAKQ